jgi:mono/diheme cytochrome c family protein
MRYGNVLRTRTQVLGPFAAMLVITLLSLPISVSAIPVFANGQGGVNCGLCHTAVPYLNSYGRYALMTNFSRGLNKHLQMMQNRSLPVALEVTANTSNPSAPLSPSVYNALTQFLSGGFVGSKVSYFASVPVVAGGIPASSVDQLWGAYNGLSRGNGSLQIGRFPTPIFAPWTSQSVSLSGYGVATLPVGLNGSTLADNRWGASYTQMGHLGLIGNVSYLTGTAPIERAFSSGGEGTAWSSSIQYLSPESRWSGGLAGLRGSYPLPSGARDPYTRAAMLISYDGERYQLTAMGTVGHDNNPNDGASLSATSHGTSLESIYGPLSWLHLDLRYEHTDDGLGNSIVNYISAAAFSLRPNLILTVDNLVSPGKQPAQKYQLLWAGPWYRNRFPRGTVSSSIPVSTATPVPSAMTSMPTPRSSAMPSDMPTPVSAHDAAALVNGRSIFFTNTDIDGTRITTATPARFYQSCAVCHGPNGAGGVQLADGAISAKLGSQAHMLDMGSMGSGNAKNTPWTTALFERAISTGVDQNGDRLSSVMPRWHMSERDLHDIALYISTEIR